MSCAPFILQRLTVVWPRADAAVQSVVDPRNIGLYLHSKNPYLHLISRTLCNKHTYTCINMILFDIKSVWDWSQSHWKREREYDIERHKQRSVEQKSGTEKKERRGCSGNTSSSSEWTLLWLRAGWWWSWCWCLSSALIREGSAALLQI